MSVNVEAEPQPRNPNERALTQVDKRVAIDALRAVAAVLVMAGHLRALLFVDFIEVEAKSLAAKLFYFATSLGHQSVVLFFALSGFLVGGSALATLREGRWSGRHYAIARISRIHTVLVPALALTALVDSGCRALLVPACAPPFALHGASLVLPPVATRDGLVVAVGNLLGLHGIATSTFGTNSPLWSLSNELLYYTAFGILLAATNATRRPSAPLLALALALAAFAWLPAGYFSGFLIWLAGAAVPWIATRLRAARWTAQAPLATLAGAAALFLVAVVATKVGGIAAHLGDAGLDYTVGAVAVALLAAIEALPTPPQTRSSATGLWAGLAALSFSLYAMHFPFAVLAQDQVLGCEGPRFQPRLDTLARYGLGFAALLVIGWLFARAFEDRTPRVRALLTRVTGSRFKGSVDERPRAT